MSKRGEFTLQTSYEDDEDLCKQLRMVTEKLENGNPIDGLPDDAVITLCCGGGGP